MVLTQTVSLDPIRIDILTGKQKVSKPQVNAVRSSAMPDTRIPIPGSANLGDLRFPTPPTRHLGGSANLVTRGFPGQRVIGSTNLVITLSAPQAAAQVERGVGPRQPRFRLPDSRHWGHRSHQISSSGLIASGNVQPHLYTVGRFPVRGSSEPMHTAGRLGAPRTRLWT